MSGRNIGSLAVNRVDPLGAKTQLSRHTGNQKNRWFESAVTIPAGQNFKVNHDLSLKRKAMTRDWLISSEQISRCIQ